MAIPQPPTFTGGGSLPNIGVPYSEVGPTSVPDFSSLLNYLMQTGFQAGQGVPKLQDLLTQGASSPLMQAVLGPALQNLTQGANLARQNLHDQFIASGMTGSGAEGVTTGQLENSIMGQQGNLISQIMSALLPTMVSGMNQQYANQFRFPELLAQALGISRPSTVTGSQAGMTQSMGGGGGGSMAQNPFFTPDPFSMNISQTGGSRAGASGGGGGGGAIPGAPGGFVNPALTSFSYNTPGAEGAFGGGAWQPSPPLPYAPPAGLGGDQMGYGSGIMQGYGGTWINDPSGTAGYGGAQPLNWSPLMGDVMNQPQIGMANPYGDTSYITNQGFGFGDVPIQPQDYYPSTMNFADLTF